MFRCAEASRIQEACARSPHPLRDPVFRLGGLDLVSGCDKVEPLGVISATLAQKWCVERKGLRQGGKKIYISVAKTPEC